MSLFRRGNIWWYEFVFAGQRIRESSKSQSKTVAKEAEKARRRELEKGINGLVSVRDERVRTIADVAKDYLSAYELRHRSIVFARYAAGHVVRLLGDKMVVEISEQAVTDYQSARLREKAAPKSINEEVGFLLRLLGETGDVLRARLKKAKALKLSVPPSIGKAYSSAEKDKLLQGVEKARSPHIALALTLALNVGLRDQELRMLTWKQVDTDKEVLTVGKSKTAAGHGRTIPLEPLVLEALQQHRNWYVKKFGEPEPDWYLFPAGKPRPNDPTQPVSTLKTAWKNLKTRADVTGRWHDARHTLITELAESGAGDQAIMDIAGHVSKQMLSRYSHIRMEAKRQALAGRVKTQKPKNTE